MHADAAVTGISRTPWTAARNTIQPLADVVNLTLKSRAGQTANHLEGRSSSGVLAWAMSQAGALSIASLVASGSVAAASSSVSGLGAFGSITSGSTIAATGALSGASAALSGALIAASASISGIGAFGSILSSSTITATGALAGASLALEGGMTAISAALSAGLTANTGAFTSTLTVGGNPVVRTAALNIGVIPKASTASTLSDSALADIGGRLILDSRNVSLNASALATEGMLYRNLPVGGASAIAHAFEVVTGVGGLSAFDTTYGMVITTEFTGTSSYNVGNHKAVRIAPLVRAGSETLFSLTGLEIAAYPGAWAGNYTAITADGLIYTSSAVMASEFTAVSGWLLAASGEMTGMAKWVNNFDHTLADTSYLNAHVVARVSSASYKPAVGFNSGNLSGAAIYYNGIGDMRIRYSDGTDVGISSTGSGGSISGTTGTLAKFTSATALGNSLVSESGSVVTVSGDFSATGTMTSGGKATGGDLRVTSFTTQYSIPFTTNTSGDFGASTSLLFNSSTGTLLVEKGSFSSTLAVSGLLTASASVSVPDNQGLLSTITSPRSMVTRTGTVLKVGDPDGWTGIDFSATSGTMQWRFGSSPTVYLSLTSSALTTATDLVFSSSTSIIRTNSADGADNKRLILGGGGAAGSVSRGAFLALYGNEFAGDAGDVILAAGEAGDLRLATGAGQTDRITIGAAGAVDIYSTLSVDGRIHSNNNFYASTSGAGFFCDAVGTTNYGMLKSGTSLYFRSGSTTDFLSVNSSGQPTFATAVTMSSTLAVTSDVTARSITCSYDANSVTEIGGFFNPSTGTLGFAKVSVGQNTTNYMAFQYSGSGFTPVSTLSALQGLIYLPSESVGGLLLRVDANAPIVLATQNVPRVTVSGAGAVSMSSTLSVSGVTTLRTTYLVAGGLHMDNGQGINMANSGGTVRQVLVMDSDNTMNVGGTVDGGIRFYTGLGHQCGIVTSAGKWTLGRSSATGDENLYVYGTVYINAVSTGIAFDIQNPTGNGGLRVRSGNNELNDGTEYVIEALNGTSGTRLFSVQAGGLTTVTGDLTVSGALSAGAVTHTSQNVSGSVYLVTSNSGQVVIGNSSALKSVRLEVQGGSGATAGILLTTSATDAANKEGRIKVQHYTNAEEPVTILFGRSINGSNDLFIGGNSGVENAMSQIDFFTAADTVTTNGTRRGGFNSSGVFDVVGTVNFGSSLTVSGTITLQSNVSFTGATTTIAANTTDASDTKRIIIGGGGSAGNVSRGAFIALYGNEFAGDAGLALLAAGEAGELHLATGAGQTSRLIITAAGAATFPALAGTGNRLVSVSASGGLGNATYLYGQYEFTQLIAFESAIAFSGFGSEAAATINRTAADGIVVRGINGTTNAFALKSSSGTILMRNPQGTTDLTFDTAVTMVSTLNVSGTTHFSDTVYADAEKLYIGGASNNAVINANYSMYFNIDADNNGTEEFAWGHNGATTGSARLMTLTPTTLTLNGTLAVTSDVTARSITCSYDANGVTETGKFFNPNTGTAGFAKVSVGQNTTNYMSFQYSGSGFTPVSTLVALQGLIYLPLESVGGLLLRVDANAPIVLATQNVPRLTVSGAGAVSMSSTLTVSGVTTLATTILVNGGLHMDNGQGINMKNSSGTLRQVLVMDSDNTMNVGGTVDGGIRFYTGLGNQCGIVTSAGKWTLGRSSATGDENLYVYGRTNASGGVTFGGGGTNLNYYLTGSFTATFTVGWSGATPSATIYYVRIGNAVICRVSAFSEADANQPATYTTSAPTPAAIRPASNDVYCSIIVTNSGAGIAGQIAIGTDGNITLVTYAGNLGGLGIRGIPYEQGFSYTV